MIEFVYLLLGYVFERNAPHALLVDIDAGAGDFQHELDTYGYEEAVQSLFKAHGSLCLLRPKPHNGTCFFCKYHKTFFV